MIRKKKLKFIQITLILFGFIIIFFTYSKNFQKDQGKEILSKDAKIKITKELDSKKNTSEGNKFFNIEYSGFDLSGNRYILKSKEATTNPSDEELIFMVDVEAIFYFKDDTKLQVFSKSGIYNNKTLDMQFKENVKAFYENSKLLANEAEYSNSLGFLTISDNVRVDDTRGNLIADKLFFDIKKQTLNIDSFNDGKINANIKLKWKKVLEFLKFKKDKPIFEVKDISKSYDGRPILKKLSLKVYPGECFVLLGPNGCGKTTLFSMCIGEQSPEGGKILINNKSIEQIPIHLRTKEGLGYLPQQRSVFDMSVYDNVLGVAQISIKGAENQRAITEKLLDEFNLQHLRTLNASVLSGGEIRRLMMARVMINKPKIVLLDEPLAA